MNTLSDHLGFSLMNTDIRGRIYIPKYYEPEIQARLAALESTHELIQLGDLVTAGDIQVRTGDEIGKMAYGTGLIPFVRTSDVSNWEIKTDPKQGVSEAIYKEYAIKQDVSAGDIFFVRDGTYLIGVCCLVTRYDGPLLYQSHILKFRAMHEGQLSGPLLLAALSSPIVRRQIRSKQFTADIIDTIGNRFTELILPLPKDLLIRQRIEQDVRETVEKRGQLREELRRIPYLAQGIVSSLSSSLPKEANSQDYSEGHVGFSLESTAIHRNIYVPRYYNPTLDADIHALAHTHNLVTIGDFIEQGVISVDTGIEVGKMAYGTGPVPFIRTSDMSNWELKADPKHSVSEGIYQQTKDALDVRAEDILLVRDGTYLVGTSCILTPEDTKIVYCGGIYKIRVEDVSILDPYLLITLLNTPIVRRQMRSKQFTRDVIDTLGRRIVEVVLPVPKDQSLREEVAREARRIVQARVALRNRARQIPLELEGSQIHGEGIEDIEDDAMAEQMIAT